MDGAVLGWSTLRLRSAVGLRKRRGLRFSHIGYWYNDRHRDRDLGLQGAVLF